MYFIFVVNDIRLEDKIIKGKEIVDILLNEKKWLFTQSTLNLRHINKGDKVLIYVAGAGNRYFCANFEIACSISEETLIAKNEKEDFLFSFFQLSVSISNIVKWDTKLPIKKIKDNLEFIVDKKNWGLFFRQATKIIDEEDYNLIIKTHNNI